MSLENAALELALLGSEFRVHHLVVEVRVVERVGLKHLNNMSMTAAGFLVANLEVSPKNSTQCQLW